VKPRYRWALLITLLVAALLRLANLGGKSVWLDEAATWSLASQPLAAIWSQPLEPHPPLYYTLMHYWLQLGDGEAWLRLPSALASLATVALLYRLGRLLAGPAVGLLAAALLALSPLDLWYAQEARMYSAVALVVVAMALGLAMGGWRGMALFLGSTAAGLYLSYLVLPLWAALSGLWLAGQWIQNRARRPLLGWLGASSLAWLLWLPWQPRFFAVMADSGRAFVVESFSRVTGLEFGPPFFLALLLLSGAGCAGLALAGRRLMSDPRWRQTIGLLAVAALASMTGLTPLPRLFSVKRILETGWPLVILFVAWLVVANGWPRTVRARGLLALSFLVSLVTLLLLPKDDWRAAVAYLNSQVGPDEVVWLDPGWNFMPYLYYAPNYPARWAAPGEAALRLAELTSGEAPGIWLIAERPAGRPVPGSPSEAWLDDEWRLVEARPFYRLELRHYRR
jgi:uncharacterized membrane protein